MSTTIETAGDQVTFGGEEATRTIELGPYDGYFKGWYVVKMGTVPAAGISPSKPGYPEPPPEPLVEWVPEGGVIDARPDRERKIQIYPRRGGKSSESEGRMTSSIYGWRYGCDDGGFFRIDASRVDREFAAPVQSCFDRWRYLMDPPNVLVGHDPSLNAVVYCHSQQCWVYHVRAEHWTYVDLPDEAVKLISHPNGLFLVAGKGSARKVYSFSDLYRKERIEGHLEKSLKQMADSLEADVAAAGKKALEKSRATYGSDYWDPPFALPETNERGVARAGSVGSGAKLLWAVIKCPSCWLPADLTFEMEEQVRTQKMVRVGCENRCKVSSQEVLKRVRQTQEPQP